MFNLISDDQVLEEALKRGIIDSNLLRQQIEMIRRKEIIEKHKKDHSCWQDNKGLWNTYLPIEAGKRKRVKKKTESDMEDAIIAHYLNLEKSPRINEVFEDWVSHKSELRKIQPNTVDRYNSVFNRHFRAIGGKRIDCFKPSDWEYFLERQIVEHDLTIKGFANLKSICKGMLLYAKRQGLISWNVSEMFDDMDLTERQFRQIVKDPEKEVFNEDEAIKLIKYLCAHPDKTNRAILLLYLTGMRIGEVVCLKKGDILNNEIKIRHTESRVVKDTANFNDLNPDGLIESDTHYYYVKDRPKTLAGNREVLIPVDFMCIMDGLLAGSASDFIFTNAQGERITTNVIRRRLEKINRKLGIKPKSPNKLRKTFASILLDHNIDKELIKSLMGHTDIAMTEGHYHRDRKDRAKKNEIISSLVEFKRETYKIVNTV